MPSPELNLYAVAIYDEPTEILTLEICQGASPISAVVTDSQSFKNILNEIREANQVAAHHLSTHTDYNIFVAACEKEDLKISVKELLP